MRIDYFFGAIDYSCICIFLLSLRKGLWLCTRRPLKKTLFPSYARYLFRFPRQDDSYFITSELSRGVVIEHKRETISGFLVRSYRNLMGSVRLPPEMHNAHGTRHSVGSHREGSRHAIWRRTSDAGISLRLRRNAEEEGMWIPREGFDDYQFIALRRSTQEVPCSEMRCAHRGATNVCFLFCQLANMYML